jgi:hypothetical protein
VKYSFHEDGRFQYAYDSRYASGHPNPHVEMGESRFQDRWTRQDFEPGWARLLKLAVPTDELRVPAAALDDPKLTWISPAAPGHVVFVDLLLGPSDSGDASEWPGPAAMPSEFLWRASLRRGEVLWLVVTREAMPEGLARMLGELQPAAVERALDAGATAARAPDGRIHVSGESANGDRWIVDAALPLDAAGH